MTGKYFVLPGSRTRYSIGPRCGILRMAQSSKKMYSVPKKNRTAELERAATKCKKAAIAKKTTKKKGSTAIAKKTTKRKGSRADAQYKRLAREKEAAVERQEFLADMKEAGGDRKLLAAHKKRVLAQYDRIAADKEEADEQRILAGYRISADKKTTKKKGSLTDAQYARIAKNRKAATERKQFLADKKAAAAYKKKQKSRKYREKRREERLFIAPEDEDSDFTADLIRQARDQTIVNYPPMPKDIFVPKKMKKRVYQKNSTMTIEDDLDEDMMPRSEEMKQVIDDARAAGAVMYDRGRLDEPSEGSGVVNMLVPRRKKPKPSKGSGVVNLLVPRRKKPK